MISFNQLLGPIQAMTPVEAAANRLFRLKPRPRLAPVTELPPEELDLLKFLCRVDDFRNGHVIHSSVVPRSGRVIKSLALKGYLHQASRGEWVLKPVTVAMCVDAGLVCDLTGWGGKMNAPAPTVICGWVAGGERHGLIKISGVLYSLAPVMLGPYAQESVCYELLSTDKPGHDGYHVYRDAWGELQCDCADFTYRQSKIAGGRCKHIKALVGLNVISELPAHDQKYSEHTNTNEPCFS